jgi:hypothetical protein
MPPSTRGPGWLMMAAVLDEAACTKARAALMVPDRHMTVEDLIAGGEFEGGGRMVTVAKWVDGAIAEEYIWS